MANDPWYAFSRVDNIGSYPDPAGNFYKPDSNIQAPPNYPITALLPGTVTSAQHTGFGQATLTIKLDTPINSLAQYTFYEHMGSFAPGLSVGQHISAGQLVGYNNPAGQVPLGFGLYSGPVYGSGSAWQALQNDLKPGGAGLLNPVNLLNQAKAGKINIPALQQGTSPNPLTDPIGAFWYAASPTLIQWGEYIAIFLIAITLVIVGFVLLNQQAAGKIAKVAGKAVLA